MRLKGSQICNRENSEAHTKDTAGKHNDAKDISLGSLLGVPVKLSNGIAGRKQQSNLRTQGFLSIQTGCLHALHGEQSLTALNSCGIQENSESDDVWMERIFPGFWAFREFHPSILMGIFIINLADGWMDGTDDGHTD